MIILGRRVIPLEGLPGQTVTMGPITWQEIEAFRKRHGAAYMDPVNVYELVVSHIEAHPFDVADPREIEVMALVPIIEQWTAMLVAGPQLPPLRGRSH